MSRVRALNAPAYFDAPAIKLWRATYHQLHSRGLWNGDRAALERYVLAQARVTAESDIDELAAVANLAADLGLGRPRVAA